MSELTTIGADGIDATWQAWESDDTDLLSIRWDNEAWTASGHDERAQVDYVVRLSPLWQVRQFLLFRDLAEPDLWLGTDGAGRWGEVNGAHRTDLDGGTDVFIDGIALSYVMPIRRLRLQVGESAVVQALVVNVETLGVVVRPFEYRRTAARRWSVHGVASNASDAVNEAVEFDIDQYGLPLDIEGVARRTDGDAAAAAEGG